MVFPAELFLEFGWLDIVLVYYCMQNNCTTVQKLGVNYKCPYFLKKSTVLFNEDNIK